MTEPSSPDGGSVEITEAGAGGSILYAEDRFAVRFSWEFARSPALVLVFGPPARGWEGARQAEIYAFVAAEIVRQKAPGRAYEIDLDEGVITILEHATARPPAPGRSPALARFLASIPPVRDQWAQNEHYDLAALAELDPAERAHAVTLLANRDATWREVEALAAIDDPAARAAVDRALEHHLSIETRLCAAEAMHRQGRLADLDRFIARALRQLARPSDGLDRTLRLAAAHPSETVRQALLWASWNCTDCALPCAALLLALTAATHEPFDAGVRAMLAKLGLHNSAYDRQDAFAALCSLVRMDLDFGAAE